ncbi:glycosyltransferase family 2 protein [Salinibacter ruber]|uniref:glycosyltransferase family 2 protein n=1 Tax=Salinibacter ruber TaxID=146919 RepID=UPI002168E53F|nr:glycosyltransferase family 2 protein [Salinibacter ruber]MCS3648569.1 glycosyltransferase involved in cell wall biosynthesis [Salinibacter ruber]
MSNNEIGVSVLITAFNEEEYIKGAVESIQKQTVSDWELVVVDDGSTDRTYEIVDRIAEADPRIRLFESEHVGRADALNIGLRKARGRFIAILDADDRARRNRLEKQAQYLQEHPEIGVVGAGCQFCDHDTDETWSWIPPETSSSVRRYALLGMPIPHTTIMFRRLVLDHICGYRDHEYKDYDFVVRALKYVDGCNLQEILVDLHVHDDSVMGSLGGIDSLRKTVKSRIYALRSLFPSYLIPLYAPLIFIGIAHKAFRIFVQERKV